MSVPSSRTMQMMPPEVPARVRPDCPWAAGHDHADVAFGPVVRLHLRLDRGNQVLPWQWDVNAEQAGGDAEVVARVLGAEELPAEDAEVVPHAVAVEEPVVERADPGVGLVDELAVDPEPGHAGIVGWAESSRPTRSIAGAGF